MSMRWILVFLPLLFMGCSTMKFSEAEPQPIPSFTVPEKSVKIALVLGGGGSKGLAHVGVLHELENAGIHPDLIVGCSSGAIIGALYADQPHVKRLEKLLINLKKSDILDVSLFASPFGVVKGYLLRSFLQNNLKARTFKQLQIPFIAVATDLSSGELVEFGAGEIIPSVHASSAVPGVFDPVKYLGRFLVDGGTANPIPVDTAKKYGAEVVIAIDVGEDLSEKEPYHMLGVAQRSLEISYRKLSEYVARHADIVIRMNFQDLGMFSDQYNKEIYEHGRETAKSYMGEIRQLLLEKFPPKQDDPPPMWMTID